MGERPAPFVAEDTLAPVAFDQALHRVEEIGPDRLRTQITAPHPAGHGVHQEQGHGRDDQKAGKIIDLLRPQLDEEEIEPAMRKIDQHGLVGRAGSAIPAHERQQVICRQRQAEDGPLDPAEPAVNRLRIDLFARLVERAYDDGVVHGCRLRYLGFCYCGLLSSCIETGQ